LYFLRVARVTTCPAIGWGGALWAFCPSWTWTVTLLTFFCHGGRITDLSQCTQLFLPLISSLFVLH
jgi:hypothetical protein